jgi:hypothetical protein
VLRDVYAALGIDIDPAVAAAVEEVAPGVTVDDAERAVLAAFPIGGRLALEPGLMAAAEALAPAHAL